MDCRRAGPTCNSPEMGTPWWRHSDSHQSDVWPTWRWLSNLSFHCRNVQRNFVRNPFSRFWLLNLCGTIELPSPEVHRSANLDEISNFPLTFFRVLNLNEYWQLPLRDCEFLSKLFTIYCLHRISLIRDRKLFQLKWTWNSIWPVYLEPRQVMKKNIYRLQRIKNEYNQESTNSNSDNHKWKVSKINFSTQY